MFVTKDGLDSLVQERDQKREKYLHEIEAFLTETRSLDFDERRGDLAVFVIIHFECFTRVFILLNVLSLF